MKTRRGSTSGWPLLLIPFSLSAQGPTPMPQNPSPMVEHTRPHPRLEQKAPEGRREKLVLGTLFLPAKLPLKSPTPLLVFFHGPVFVPEVAASQRGKMAVVSIHIGAGSGVYVTA